VSTIGEAGEVSLDVVGDPLAGASDRNRAAARMAAVTLVSRGSGFVRVVVVAAVLGATFLGNTYQTANSIPNLLFELVAAGALQAVLVPVLVARTDPRESDEAASAVLGATTALMAALAVVGMLCAPLVARALFVAVEDPTVRDQQVRLATVLLWCFLPQVVFYGLNLVSTATLHARGRFSLPAFAPFVNNVVVIGVYLAFGRSLDGSAPTMELTTGQVLLLGLGTTVGVVAFCLLPYVGARRVGVDLRLSWRPDHPAVRRVVRQGAWAGGYLAAGQAVLVAILVLANSVEGGVVVQQLAYVLFLLPVSLVVVPVVTTAFPKLARDADRGEWSQYRAEVRRSGRIVVAASVGAATVLVLARVPLAHVVAFGNAAVATDQVAVAVAGFAVGLPGFAAALLLTRASYAVGDTRNPTLVAVAVAALAVGAMVAAAAWASDEVRVGALGVAHALAWTVGAVVLWFLLRRNVRLRTVTP
jgi:putative peptidoglycan lipid II flippase